MTNLIEAAVVPLKNDAIAKANEFATNIVAKITKELEEAGWDAQVVAPFPRGFGASGTTYQQGKAKYTLYRSIVAWERSSRSMKDPEIVRIDEKRVEKFIKEAEETAAAQYDAFVAKLVAKVGEDVVEAKLEGNHVWGYSHLFITRSNGERECYKTQMIINVSKLGKLFNQWPTRKVKVK